MANNYKQTGKHLTFLLAATVVSGTPFLMGTKLAVPLQSGVSGDTIEVAVEGVWNLPKAGSQAWAQGAAIYWDDTAKNCTTTATSNTLIGYAAAPALSADTKGDVKLNG